MATHGGALINSHEQRFRTIESDAKETRDDVSTLVTEMRRVNKDLYDGEDGDGMVDHVKKFFAGEDTRRKIAAERKAENIRTWRIIGWTITTLIALAVLIVAAMELRRGMILNQIHPPKIFVPKTTGQVTQAHNQTQDAQFHQLQSVR